MNNGPKGEIYSIRYYDLSPTWFAWNKLSAADVYQLREEPSFAGQKIWFWHNHPIRFVRLVGFIVQIDLVASGKYALLTLDDSSGANIELKVERMEGAITPNGKEWATHTVLENVDVTTQFGLPVVWLGGKALEPGDVVRAEGLIERFMDGRQMDLQRVSRVKDTNEEAMHWTKVSEWKKTVLSKPWVLCLAQKDEIDLKVEAEQKEALKRERHLKKRKSKHDERLQMVRGRQEERRQAQEKLLNAGALPGSEILKMPWDR